MDSERSWKSITKVDIQQALRSYQTVLPNRVRDLDDYRSNEIPRVLARRKEEKNPYLEKKEVEKLIEWKLYRTLQAFCPSITYIVTGSMGPSGPL